MAEQQHHRVDPRGGGTLALDGMLFESALAGVETAAVALLGDSDPTVQAFREGTAGRLPALGGPPAYPYPMALVALLVSIFAAVTTVGAAAITWRQLRAAERANMFPTVVELFREYRSADMLEARRVVFHVLAEDIRDTPLTRLPDEVRLPAMQLSHYLDNLGVLVSDGLVDPRIVARFLGISAIATWIRLEPHIRSERILRDDNMYQMHFENLVATVRDLKPHRLLEQKLKRLTPFDDELRNSLRAAIE